jgi:DNA-directed RNA polymerase specialized sigma24 family protein
MFEEKPEISDTLVWMLQSRQVGDETLVNTLVHEQYAPLYRLAFSFFNSPDSESAEKLAEQVITEAVKDANQYREEIGVEIWLFRKAFKAYERWTAKKTHVIDNLVTGGEPKVV